MAMAVELGMEKRGNMVKNRRVLLGTIMKIIKENSDWGWMGLLEGQLRIPFAG